MRTFRRTLLAGAVALALSTPAVAQFTNAIFFGDSLLDAGSFKPVVPPGTGLFTTNPGPIWVTPFGQNFGFGVSPANQGGTDYAYGGARVTLVPGYPPVAADRERRPDRDADRRVPREGSGRPNGHLRDRRRRERHLHSVHPAAGRDDNAG